MKEKTLGLYIHIPFCRSKCNYCGFLSEPLTDESLLATYVDLVCQEITLYGQGRFAPLPGIAQTPLNTVYIGGGTPSLMTGEQVQKIMDTVREQFHLTEDAEVSLEGNPESYTLEKLQAYRKAGINRISMGLQAVQCELLQTLGRIHDFDTFKAAYDNAVAAGFDNINVDVMFGLPDQSEQQWQETLEALLALNPTPTHISTYSLQIEEETPFYRMYKDGEIDLPPYEVDRAMYHHTIEKLTGAGYEHYEISNFAKPGFESRHNLKYWNMEDFIGVGLGASSYVKPVRFQDVSDLFLWNRILAQGRLPIMQQDNLTPIMVQDAILKQEPLEDAASTYVFTGLRKREGIRFDEFNTFFGRDFWELYEDYRSVIDDYVAKGLLKMNEEGMRLTEAGIDVSNEIFADLLLEKPEPEEPAPGMPPGAGMPM